MSNNNYWGNKVYFQSLYAHKNSGLKTNQSGKAFCTVTVSDGQGKNTDGSYKPSPFYNLIATDDLVHHLQYVTKGDRLYVEGKFSYSTFIDKNGVERGSHTIWAHKVEIINRS